MYITLKRSRDLICVFRRSHIFDGVTIAKETAAFQLCDIQDPMLKEMIEKEEDLRETCDVRGYFILALVT